MEDGLAGEARSHAEQAHAREGEGDGAPEEAGFDGAGPEARGVVGVVGDRGAGHAEGEEEPGGREQHPLRRPRGETPSGAAERPRDPKEVGDGRDGHGELAAHALAAARCLEEFDPEGHREGGDEQEERGGQLWPPAGEEDPERPRERGGGPDEEVPRERRSPEEDRGEQEDRGEERGEEERDLDLITPVFRPVILHYSSRVRLCHHCGEACNDTDRFCSVCGTPALSRAASDDPLIGRMIGGSYLIQELVGVGGMGRVYKAEQANLGRTVALKVIHPHLLSDEQTVARFYTEARAASRLNHPNSVGVIDFGRTEDGILYLVMELLKGQDLAQLMHAEGPLPFERILDILIQVLEGLAEAHALDIVHRDLKPENIIITRYRSGRDLVKVVDFGLAMIVDGGQTNITRPGLVCGTPDYMAPEQGRGEDVDGRGDLYALGVVLYELLTERLPFVDDTPTKVVLRHLYDPVVDPREVAPHRGIPESLVQIVFRALEKDRERRFQTAEEMKLALMEERDRLRYNFAAQICGECGADNPADVRFCGNCGTQLQKVAVPRNSIRVQRSRTSLPPPSASRTFVGRARELEELASLMAGLDAGARFLGVEGEVGVGKTRLLHEFACHRAGQGDVVALVGPHPSGAPVAFHAVRELVAQLAGVSIDALGSIAIPEDETLARAGLSELVEPSGLRGAERRSRAGAVAVLVARLLDAAIAEQGARRAFVVFDDSDRCDGLSRETITALRPLVAHLPVLVVPVAASGPLVPVDQRMRIEGLEVAEAESFKIASGILAELAPSARRGFSPLLLEQLERLTENDLEADAAPRRLGEAVLQRLQGLPASAIRALQAACVLGTRYPVADLEALLDEPLRDETVGVLAREQLMHVAGGQFIVTHPYVAELIEGSIPAQARKELHEKAFKLLSSQDAPIEVIAEHAYRGAAPLIAMLQLERMGDTARRRGDDAAAVFAYRRALEVARRALFESAEFMMEAASISFSYKLGEALLASGDLTGADGVLREALDSLGPNDVQRARFFLSLGRVALARERPRDAMRHLGMALELIAFEDSLLEARVQAEIARVRLEGRDFVHAANALRRAVTLLSGDAQNVEERVRLMVMLARTELELGTDTAETTLREAKALAHQEGLLTALAEIEGIRGLLAKRSGVDPSPHFAVAVEMFSEAGDTRGLERWKDAKGAA